MYKDKNKLKMTHPHMRTLRVHPTWLPSYTVIEGQSSVSCPGLSEWYAHLASGLYLGEAVLGFLGGSLNVTRFNLNRCCKA